MLAAMRAAVWSSLVVLVAGSPLAAQPAERETVFGEVRTLDREPWGAATVVLRSRPVPHLDLGELDTVVTTTDGRGRFRAHVLPWREYTVWCRSEPDASGAYRATDPAEHVTARSGVALREAKQARRAGRVLLDGLEPWKHRAPFSYRLASAVEHEPEARGDVDADGCVRVPPMPGASARLEILGRGEFPICAVALSLDALPERASIPAPVRVRIEVTAGSEAAFPGGTYHIAWRGRLPQVAVIDPSGKAEVEVAAGAKSWEYVLVAHGLAPGLPGPSPMGTAGPWVGQMVAGAKLRGRLLIARGIPAAGFELWVRDGRYTIRPDTHAVGVFDRVVTTDAEGRFAITASHCASLCALIPAAALAKLPQAWRGGGVHPLAWLGEFADDGDVDIGDLVLTESLWLAHVKLGTPDGAPVIGGCLTFESSTGGGIGRPVVRTDRRGEARLLLPKNDLAVIAWHDDAWCVQRARAHGGSGDVVDWRMQLAPPRFLDGTVRDVAGQVVANQRVLLWLDHQQPAELLEPVPPAVVQGTFRLEFLDRFEANRLQNLVIGELMRRQVHTDASGRFRFSLPHVACTLRLGPHEFGRAPNVPRDKEVVVPFTGTTVEGIEVAR